MQDRGIINTRDEPLVLVPNVSMFEHGWKRMHLIMGDATMCEVASYLRFAMTGMMVELMEMNALPAGLDCDHRFAVRDLHRIADSTNFDDWYLRGPGGCIHAMTVLERCCSKARAHFYHRDDATDCALYLWEEVLNRLHSKDREAQLFGWLDWTTKYCLVKRWLDDPQLRVVCTDRAAQGDLLNELRTLDLRYHQIDPYGPECGYYYRLREEGQVVRVISDEMIEYAKYNPPSNTRAYARGEIAKHISELDPPKCLSVNGKEWIEVCVLSVKKPNAPNPLFVESIGLPWEPYADVLERAKKQIC